VRYADRRSAGATLAAELTRVLPELARDPAPHDAPSPQHGPGPQDVVAPHDAPTPRHASGPHDASSPEQALGPDDAAQLPAAPELAGLPGRQGASEREAGDNLEAAIVLGLVRGGVPVAAEVAARLGLPLDVLVVRKLGVPWAPEVAFGALGPGGVRVANPEVASHLREPEMAAVARREAAELARRELMYRRGRPALRLAGRTAIVVDDGLATGATARVAVAVARRLGAARVVLAVPVAAQDSIAVLRREADVVVCPLVPAQFGAVSQFYADFRQVGDAVVIRLMAAGRTAGTRGDTPDGTTPGTVEA